MATGRNQTCGMTPVQRFFSFVRITLSGCWEWATLSAPRENAYPYFWNGQKVVRAARFAYEMLHGNIPEGLEVDHLCRNPKCVNPYHLEAVTHRVNMLRGHVPMAEQAKQTSCIHGHPFDENNTYRKPNGSRQCKVCRRETDKKRKQNAKASRRIP